MATRVSHGSFEAVLVGVLLYTTLCLLSIGNADVTSSGLGTNVNQATPGTFNISGGTRPGGGTNLFHSFGNFSLNTPESANFLNDSGLATTNILSRVTGGNPSRIFGTINTSSFGTANLFLMNPAGIIFGPTAQLNVGGSFHATTADYIKLGNDGIFFADTMRASALTVSPPSAFGFLTSNPAAIDVQAGVFSSGTFTNRLQVPTGRTLSLVGGTVNVGAPSGQPPAGFVFAPGGVVNIASVASPGEATLGGAINVDGFAKLGEIHITGGAIVDGREINIRSGRLEITDATLFPGISSQARLPNAPAPNGGQVSIKVTDDVSITGTGRSLLALPGIQTFAGATNALVQGDVPSVNIEAGRFSMSGNAGIVTNRFGPGAAPTVAITADTVELRNGAAIAMSNSFGGGTFPTGGGTLTIKGGDMTLSSDGSPLFTGIAATGNLHPAYGSGPTTFSPFFQFADSASITINLTGNFTVRGNAGVTTDNFAFGRSGAISINAANMLLVGAGPETGRIAAQSGIAGESGSVRLAATGRIDMQNGFLVSANTLGSGNGGTVDVTAGGPITLTGANTRVLSGTSQPPDQQLNSFAQRFAGIFGVPAASFTYAALRTRLGIAPAPGDLMQVLARLAALRDSAGNPLVAVTDFTAGDAGRVFISTPLLTMNADTRIETSTGWDGNAGAVIANLGSLSLNDGAAIRSSSGIVLLTGGQSVGAGDAGSVTITATGPISISGRSPTTGAGSSISTTTQGAGNGGDIVLNSAGTVQISNGGVVSADSVGGRGLAGNINIAAGDQIVMNQGSVSTRAATSDGGNITLNAPNLIALTNSQVTTSVESGVGGGGNITIDPQALVLNNSKILANAFGGPGGNINITADVFLVNSGGVFPTSLTGIVDASSALSTPGTVNIEATFTNVSGTFAQLPGTPLQATELLRASCAARFAGGKTSSLVLGGRDGLPLQPGGLLPSPLYLASDADTPSTGTKVTGYDQSLQFSLLGSKDRLLNQYSLLPNVKCSL